MWLWGLYQIWGAECQEGQGGILKQDLNLCLDHWQISSFLGNLGSALKAL